VRKKTVNMVGSNQPRSGDISLAPGFSRGERIWRNWRVPSGTKDVCRAYGTRVAQRTFPPAKAGGYRNLAATRLN